MVLAWRADGFLCCAYRGWVLDRLRRVQTHTINVLSVVAAVAVATLAVLPGLLSGGWLVAALVAVAAFNALAHALTRFEQSRSAEEARARSRLDVSLHPADVVCAAVADLSEVVAEWRPREEAECLASLAPRPEAAREFVDLDALPEPDGSVSHLSIRELRRLEERKKDGGDLTEEEEQALAAAQAQIRRALEPMTRGVMSSMAAAFGGRTDRRTEAEYRAEVSAYLDEAEAGLAEWLLCAEVQQGVGALQLSVINRTDRNYDRVLIEVYLPGKVSALDPEQVGKPEPLPGPPRPLGEPESLPHSTFDFPSLAHSLNVPPLQPLYGLEIDNSGSTRIRFAPVSLRPKESVELDPVILRIHEPPTTVLDGTWTATATNADGRVEGALLITVTEPGDPRSLLARVVETSDAED